MKRNYAGMVAEVEATVVVGRNVVEEVDQGEGVQAGEKEEAGVGPGEGAEAGPGREAEVPGEGAVAGLKGKVEVNQDGEVEVDQKEEVKGQEARKDPGDQEAKIGEDLRVKIREDREVERDLLLMKSQRTEVWNRKMLLIVLVRRSKTCSLTQVPRNHQGQRTLRKQKLERNLSLES